MGFATFATLRHFQLANLAVDLQSGVCAGQSPYVSSPLQVAKVRDVFAGQGRFAIRHLLRGGELANLEPCRDRWRTCDYLSASTARNAQIVTDGGER